MAHLGFQNAQGCFNLLYAQRDVCKFLQERRLTVQVLVQPLWRTFV